MSRVAIKEESLRNLADKIREKTGAPGGLDVDEMAEAVASVGAPELEELVVTDNGEYIPETYGYSKVTVDCPMPPPEVFNITETASYRFAYGGWDWFIERYRDRITANDLTSCANMFIGSLIEELPFQINLKEGATGYNLGSMFENCKQLKVCPKIRGPMSSTAWNYTHSFSNIIYQCSALADIEDLFTPEMLEGYSTFKVTSPYLVSPPVVIRYNASLRRIPSWWHKFKLNPESTAFPSTSYIIYSSLCQYCSALDEITNIPVWTCQAAATSNLFSSAFSNSSRVQAITFETNADGSPIEAKWKSQTINLANNTGNASSASDITSYSSTSGITTATVVNTDEAYQALKNDPDWWTTNPAYSRYNHDSAVETINSLPDTSAYLATAGGTNTITFKGTAGSKTDGGAINTLTEEEIAVAVAKGWTITFA